MLTDDRIKALHQLAAELQYEFKNVELLQEALTHPSISGIRRKKRAKASKAVRQYERLEFLGDRVLGLVIADWLIGYFPEEQEGDLAKRHTALVQAKALQDVAEKIHLGDYIVMSAGEEVGGGRTNPSILADCAEAIIGAMYRDGGLAPAQKFIRHCWQDLIDLEQAPPQDPKTQLQEFVQAKMKALPIYQVVSQSGPQHEPEFCVEVSFPDSPKIIGKGGSKREAEKQAAREMLKHLGETLNG